MNDAIKETLAVLPNAPGVYIMHDASGKVIYVGKAVILKNRVRSYFRPASQVSPKVRAINAHVAGLASAYGYSITYGAAMKYCPPNYDHWFNATLGQMQMI